MLCLVALAAALIVWAALSGTSGDKKDSVSGPDGRKPPATIMPSPGPSEPPAVTDRPGGTGGSGSGDDRDSGTGGPRDSEDPEGAGGSGGPGGSGTGGGQPAGASVPSCTAARTELTVRSSKNSYEPGEKPQFKLVVSNSGSHACKVDLGQQATILTITRASDNSRVWSSGDCPDSSVANLVQVPAKSSSRRTYDWNRERSAPHCATPPTTAKAGAGTYLVEAHVPGVGSAKGSFVLRSS